MPGHRPAVLCMRKAWKSYFWNSNPATIMTDKDIMDEVYRTADGGGRKQIVEKEHPIRSFRRWEDRPKSLPWNGCRIL